MQAFPCMGRIISSTLPDVLQGRPGSGGCGTDMKKIKTRAPAPTFLQNNDFHAFLTAQAPAG